jgi:hypothetical protein
MTAGFQLAEARVVQEVVALEAQHHLITVLMERQTQVVVVVVVDLIFRLLLETAAQVVQVS